MDQPRKPMAIIIYALLLLICPLLITAETREHPEPDVLAPDAPLHGSASMEDVTPLSAEELDFRLYRRYCVKTTVSAKTVYLTIDDGPDPRTTPFYLQILAEKGVKATFFILGRQVESYPELAWAIKAQGHTLGNHTYSHDYRYIYSDPLCYLGELQKTQELLRQLLGEETTLTRAPGGTYGHFTLEFYRILEDHGFTTYDWNIDTQDALIKNITANRILENVVRQNRNRSTAVVLMHDIGKKADIEALPKVIDYYLEAGYEFQTLKPDSPVVVHKTAALEEINKKYMPENSEAGGREKAFDS